MSTALRRSAAAVLGRNWRGLYTVPAGGLYPHQWSWDSAFIAIGLCHLSPRRAQQEIETLLSGQWADGRLPQIIFQTGHDDAYSPGRPFWRSERLPGAPVVPTAGLIQPPNHAWAALLVHLADPEESARRSFLERAYPKLSAWHGYLSRRRNRGGSGLAALVHPWETGMDNSPPWDEVLARIELHGDDAVPRPDLLHADASERPTNSEYGRYLYLAGRYRDHGCDDQDPDFPFLVEDPGTNALWIASEHALAEIARLVGEDPRPHTESATRLTEALGGLFDDERGIFLARDVTTGRLLDKATVSGLLPLLVEDLPQRERLLATLFGPMFDLEGTVMVPSYDLTAPDADLARYWRGPAWFNTTWLLVRALRSCGHQDAAARLSRHMRGLALAHDFPEYVHPMTGAPHGTRAFSWTAALALDLSLTEM